MNCWVRRGGNKKSAYALGVVVGYKYVRFIRWKETVVIDILQARDTTVRPECRQERVRKAKSEERYSKHWMSSVGSYVSKEQANS